MNQPQIVRIRDIDLEVQVHTTQGNWRPARPLPYYFAGLGNLRNRLRCAWLVFTGKCDALRWD